MNRITEHLLSPNAWVALFSILAVGGLGLCGIGLITHTRALIIIGLWLGAPLVLGGIIILFAVLPLLLVFNWKQRKKTKRSPNRQGGNKGAEV